MNVVVTGAAGFIGSTLVDRLVAAGDDVVAVDALHGPRHPDTREANLKRAIESPNVRFRPVDLLEADLGHLFSGVDTIFHLAGRPGVQTSWGRGFDDHLRHNTFASHLLLTAARVAGVRRVVVASSSSVYGPVPSGSVAETRAPTPVSPYGVSKLAVEHVAAVEAERGLSVVCLRYFSVYGPRQRPDMAPFKVIDAALGGSPFTLFGDGRQARDLTFVADVVDATLRAGVADLESGTVINVGGERPVALNEVVAEVARLVGHDVPVERGPRPPGDPDRTAADVSRARALLGWTPTTSLSDGLAHQIAWQRSLRH